MEAVEVGVYLAVAVIVAGLVTGFILDWDFMGMYKKIQHLFMNEKDLNLKNIESERFPGELYDIWTHCRALQNSSVYYLHVTGGGTISKSWLFSKYKTLNWCESIQSHAETCGLREDVNMPSSISLPAIIKISCGQSMNVTI
jgi:hypothetical protein